MSNGSQDRQRTFLSQYHLERKYLLRPDRRRGRPGIRLGVDGHGNPVLIKVWPKASSGTSTDLREMWRNEVRQLHRLGGYPGASENIAILQRADEDESGFYLVLEPGQRRPLATILANAPSDHWLRNPRQPAHRAALWENMIRVSAGMQTLHDQGLVHRNVNKWAVLATGTNEHDFQLTGFEWSIRIAGATTSTDSKRNKRRKSARPISFLDDWVDLGRLIATLLDLDISRVIDTKIAASAVTDYLNIEEIRLLRVLLRVDAVDRLDAEVIERRIREILRRLRARVANRSTQLHLVVRLGPNSDLTQRIREQSEHIESDFPEQQMAFLEDDLRESPRLLAVKTPWDNDSRIILQGTKLTYRLQPFIPSPLNSTPTWDFAYCHACVHKEPARTDIVGDLELEPNSLSILNIANARKKYSRMRGGFRSWEELKREFEASVAPPTRDKRFHQALALTQFIEAVFAAADAFAVDVIDQSLEGTEDFVRLVVRTREDHERDQLSTALRLRAPTDRFREALIDERADGNWVLTESRQVGTQSVTDTEWRFEKEQPASDGTLTFVFAGGAPPPPLTDPLMIPGDFIGRDILFQRRLNALRALADHAELLWMLVDPRRRILDTHDSIEGYEFLSQMDTSKQEAIAEIATTVPLYLLQGPPGVGKTYMVKALVRYIFDNENAARVLLTAQSNAAVDHLLSTLHEMIETEAQDMLAVRCRAPDRNQSPSAYDVQKRATDVLQDFSQSALVKAASTKLIDRTVELASHMGERETSARFDNSGRSAANEKQAVEGLVLRAANIVFATTNSRELERLVDDRGQFDWTVVEEAGKALGVELIAPLLLSYRRLLIGDHKQLAPFGADRLHSLLANPASVIDAIKWGRDFVSRTLRDPSTDEVLDEIDRDDQDESSNLDFGALCALALRNALLFERIVDEEFETHLRSPNLRRIARRLDQQHRMHPTIAALVSRCFYSGALSTHQQTDQRFAQNICPVRSRDTHRLPDVPIVVIDVPYVQSKLNMRGAEQYPRWHNPLEVDAVAEVLQLLEAQPSSGRTASLAVLSPYNEQVKRLQSRLDEQRSSLQNLDQFRPGVAAERFCGTVDSFQGNEADVVIVSLVRNNHHASVRSAFGFLCDSRRMNVLLSRAKWRLVLVFSREFIETVLDSSTGTTASANVEFMREMLAGLEDARAAGQAAFVAWDDFTDGAAR